LIPKELANFKDIFSTWIASFILIIVIAVIDFYTGYQLSFSIFYLMPVIWITWKAGKLAGIIYSFLSAIAWLEADLLAEHLYTNLLIPYWNALMRLGMFILITYLLSALKQSLLKEQQSSRTDHLTQISNSKAFMEILKLELERAKRYGRPFSVSYVDVDDFKMINDTQGHQAGDELLKDIARIIQESLRQVDIVSRLGGDEFCILLPETNQEMAAEVLRRVNDKLKEILFDHSQQVTFSIGCVTYKDVPDSLDEIIQIADDLMYQVKKTGKNNILFRSFTKAQ